MRRRLIGGAGYLVQVGRDPVGDLPGVGHAPRGKDRGPGHPVAEDAHLCTARPGDRAAPPVHGGDERPLGRREREIERA